MKHYDYTAKMSRNAIALGMVISEQSSTFNRRKLEKPNALLSLLNIKKHITTARVAVNYTEYIIRWTYEYRYNCHSIALYNTSGERVDIVGFRHLDDFRGVELQPSGEYVFIRLVR